MRTSAEMPQSTEEDPKITSFEASWNRLEAAYLALINCPNSTGMNRRNFYAASQKQQTQETNTNSLDNLQSLQKHQMLHQQQHQQPRQLLPQNPQQHPQQRPQQHRHQQRHHHNSFSSQNSAQNTARQFGFTEMYEDNQLPAINKSNTSNNCSSINTATSNATVPNVGLIVDSDNNQTTAKVTPAQDANIPLRAPMTLADLLESPADGINDYIMLA